MTAWTSTTPDEIRAWRDQLTRSSHVHKALLLSAALERIEALESQINSPELLDFIAAIQRETVHQVERWGADHDKDKTPEDWLWVVAYLSTKATQAARYGDHDKYLHHIITTAAACANWHRLAVALWRAMPRAG